MAYKNIIDPIGYERGMRYKIVAMPYNFAEFKTLKSAKYWLSYYKKKNSKAQIRKIVKK